MDKSFYANFYAKLKTIKDHTKDHINSMEDYTNLSMKDHTNLSTEDHTNSLMANSIDLSENYLNSTEKEYLKSLDTNLLETSARTSSELEFNHQNQELRIGLIKEFFDSICQDLINNNQLLSGMENFKKQYEKAKNIFNGQLISFLHQNLM
ncbi:unnamed protein product [Rhizophagus irregularis]|uniref:Uncharacterized protein n=1 Tax=Rhizophagus irregularis TaxID=588596 RepID=A0A2I1HU49_9GLOM|nr:hypothetical protein RhiirA4_488847 [Rhizophagus irregularis]CAB4442074.1 unnamed protein product [Rhizophagus irregularis]CAB4442180.1 unnamed protein product [Rhizophagus irregularis]